MDVLGSDFDQFVRDSSPGLLRTAYLLTGDRGHAEDIVQTALLQVARKWRRIRGEPTPYARRAVTNLAKNHWRHRFRRPNESTRPSSPAMPHPNRTCCCSRCCCVR
jgi:DNA-directed RNA polymerase specialized sigma24 family protein